MITSKRVNELFDYDPLTGVLTSKVERGGCHPAGETVTPGLRKGRVWGFTVDGKAISAIRLVRLLRGDDSADNTGFIFADGDRTNLRSSNVVRRMHYAELTPVIARENFHIDGSTLRWKRSAGSMARAGDQAGTVKRDGSAKVMLSGRFYNCVHVAYLIAYGAVAEGYKVRPKTGDWTDCHPTNLRVVRIGGPTAEDDI